MEAKGIPGTGLPHRWPTRSNTDLASFLELLSQLEVRAAPVPPACGSLVSWRADRRDFGMDIGYGPPAQPCDEIYLGLKKKNEIQQ